MTHTTITARAETHMRNACAPEARIRIQGMPLSTVPGYVSASNSSAPSVARSVVARPLTPSSRLHRLHTIPLKRSHLHSAPKICASPPSLRLRANIHPTPDAATHS